MEEELLLSDQEWADLSAILLVYLDEFERFSSVSPIIQRRCDLAKSILDL
jgi:hypothetical protein